jgi:hypothetical protein
MKLDWLSFAVFALLSARGLAVEQAAARPNIVFIISDDQAWSDYGFMGHPQVATPRLDRLAAESLTFQPRLHAGAVVPAFAGEHRDGTLPASAQPSRATIPELCRTRACNAMAGRGNPKYARYYDTIIGNFRSASQLHVRDLTARGYVALQTGKWWEGDPVKTAGFTHAMTAGTRQGRAATVAPGWPSVAKGWRPCSPSSSKQAKVAARSWSGMRRCCRTRRTRRRTSCCRSISSSHAKRTGRALLGQCVGMVRPHLRRTA